MRLAVLTPLPPVRSGIANYAALLLPRLGERVEVTAVVDQEQVAPLPGLEILRLSEYRKRRGEFDRVVGQIGNNLFHEFVYAEAMEHPMVVVLHDFVLHHLIFEMTIARGDRESYVRAIEASEGIAGAVIAGTRHRVPGEAANFLYPASSDLARRSRGVVVHNRWAAEELRRRGVETPIVAVGHPFDESVPPPRAAERQRAREELGLSPAHRVIGMFGFLTAAKRPEAVFEAFAKAYRRDPNLRLLLVGEAPPNSNVDPISLAKRFEVPDEAWRVTGFVSDERFDRLLAAVDRVVNLRYPSAGEMSGPLIQAFRIGLPVAVSRIAQFADLPGEVVTHIPLTAGEEIDSLAAFMAGDADQERIRSAQRAWLRENAAMERVVEGYLRALAGENDVGAIPPIAPSSLPLTPRFTVERLQASPTGSGWRAELVVRNDGAESYRAAAFGEPSLRFLAKGYAGEREIGARWIAPTGDLPPGGSMEATAELPREATQIAIFVAISGVPHFDKAPIARLEL